MSCGNIVLKSNASVESWIKEVHRKNIYDCYTIYFLVEIDFRTVSDIENKMQKVKKNRQQDYIDTHMDTPN